ncbi:MAG TPA: sigma factor-like helix-turn-helix DNA-binding protein, partial [Polyangiales bacterium]
KRQDARWRRSQEEGVAESVLGTAPPAPGSERELLDAARRLQAILMQLDEKQRAVFVLFELYEESCESIAAGLDMKIGTVYSRLHAARLTFRRLSERDDETPVKAVRG